MTETLVLAVLAFGVALVSALRRQKRLQGIKRWRRAANALGLELRRGGSLEQALLIGRWRGGPHEVVIDVRLRETPTSSQPFTRVCVRSGATPRNLLLERVAPAARGSDTALGEELFAGAIWAERLAVPPLSAEDPVAGPLDEAFPLAALDAGARRAVVEAVTQSGVRLEYGAATVELPGVEVDPARLTAQVEALSALLDELDIAAADVPRRLAANAASDPLDWARLRNLETLLRGFPRSPEAAAAARAALSDACPWMRLLGAMATRPGDGIATVPLAAAFPLPARLHRAVVEHLAALPADPTSLDLLEAALGAADPLMRAAAVRGLGGFDAAPVVPLLARLAGEADAELGRAVASTAVGIGSPEVEPILLALLDNDDVNARMTAIEGLGKLGTAAAVRPLHQHEGGVLTPGFYRQAVRAAIEHIKARLPAAQAGGLSLVEPADEAGSLSLVADAPTQAGDRADAAAVAETPAVEAARADSPARAEVARGRD